MPVVESYPSIVGIAQVAQAAGQGRYNQWLAEYNARSNQMKTNALMSGFQTGSSLGMSIGNMWQQQAQFAQRQGFIESQAAQQLQKDTEFTQAMIPALDPLVQQMYPHLNEEQRGAYIGSLDRRQVDAMVNNLGNASRAKAAYDLFGSPQAVKRQAENTLRNRLMGKEHHNARVQSRLQPIWDRIRNSDFKFNESAVVGEISRILQEEGEATPGTNPQEQYNKHEITVTDANGNPAYRLWMDPKGKVHHFDIRPRGGTGTTPGTRTPMEIMKDANTLQGYIDNRHNIMTTDWEKRYGEEAKYEPNQVGTIERNGKYYRPLTSEELRAQGYPLGKGSIMVPARIPPRPTRHDAEEWVKSQYPGFSSLIGSPAPVGVGVPAQPQLPRPAQPAPGLGQQPGAAVTPRQAMPTTPTLPTQPAPLPPERVEPIRSPEMIQVQEEARGIAIQKIRGAGRTPRPGEIISVDGKQVAYDPKNRKHERAAHFESETGAATHRGLTELLGSEGRQQTGLMDLFQRYVRSGRKAEDFGKTPDTAMVGPLMATEEAKLLQKNIKEFDDKARQTIGGYAGGGGFTDPDQIPTERIPDVLRKMFKTDPDRAHKLATGKGLFTQKELRQFFKTNDVFDRKRDFVTKVAAAAVRATPPGERPDIANLPIMDQRTFESRVAGVGTSGRYATFPPIRPGDVFLTPRDGIFVVTQFAIDAAQRSYLLRHHGQTQPPVPGFPAQPVR